MSFGILVGGPPRSGMPPVLDDVSFSKLLTLAVTEAALRLAGGYQMRLVQIDFEPFPDVVLNGRSWAPRATAFLHSNSVRNNVNECTSC